MISCTGNPVREDTMGSGRFKAPRKGRLHNGIDELCIPGQTIWSPINGKVNRKIIVYSDDYRWKGVEIFNEYLIVQIFYVEIYDGIVGMGVKKEQAIGVAQDITEKYSQEMKPHVHVQAYINPKLLERL